MLRTHTAGSLRAEHIGQTVTLTGWVDRRRDHGGVAFIDLRDASGIAQVVIRDEAVAHGLRNEYVLQVTGAVGARPEGNANDHLATGAVELVAQDVVVLNEAAPLPFQVSSALDEHIGEEEREVFPVIREHVSAADFVRCEELFRKGTSIGQLAFLLPWVADQCTPAERAELLATAGRPLVLLLRLTEPRYARRMALVRG